MELLIISEEQSKALKELGFPQKYDELDLCHYYVNLEGGKYRKATFEVVADWLRKNKGLHMFVDVELYHGETIWIGKLYNLNSPSNFHSFNCLGWKECYNYNEAISTIIDIAIEILYKKIKKILH